MAIRHHYPKFLFNMNRTNILAFCIHFLSYLSEVTLKDHQKLAQDGGEGCFQARLIEHQQRLKENRKLASRPARRRTIHGWTNGDLRSELIGTCSLCYDQSSASENRGRSEELSLIKTNHCWHWLCRVWNPNCPEMNESPVRRARMLFSASWWRPADSGLYPQNFQHKFASFSYLSRRFPAGPARCLT